MKKAILSFINSNKFKTFLWQTVNNFLVLLTLTLAEPGLEFEYKATILLFAQPGLNALTKFINKKYLAK